MAGLLDNFTSPLEAYSPIFHGLSRPVAEAFGLKNLGPHFDVLVYSFVLFNFANIILVPGLSRLFFNRIYGALNPKARNKWNCRAVSLIHVSIVVPLAIQCLDSPTLSADRAFGWDERAGTAFSVAAAYFLWDTIDMILHFEAIGFVAHGAACFFVYFLCFRPFLAYYAVRCLLWEGSTIFLNFHWYMDKSGFSGSRLQTVNGVLLLASFTGLRIVFGGYISYAFSMTVLQVRDQVPLGIALYYACGNLLLQGLNWFWLFAMLKGFKKRMSSSATEPQVMHRKAE